MMKRDEGTINITKLASVVRSKNAGPFIFTFDIIFKNGEIYEGVKRSDVITRDFVASLYGVPPERIIGVYYLDAARAMKISLLKTVASGDPKCTDTMGCQQHGPLLDIEIPAKFLPPIFR